jgi:hypothetical protein
MRKPRMNIGFRLCLYFAANPDEVLSTKEIAERFGFEFSRIASNLAAATRAGYIVRVSRGNGKTHTVFGPGPKLTELWGESSEDEPVRQIRRPAGTWEREHKGAPASWCGV